MTKLLSIGIPTYNRAAELDRQLAWLAHEIKGFEHECDIAVYDNHSTDKTTEVVERWREAFRNVPFRYVKHPKNLGGLPNYASFLRDATGTFTWAIGDDDPINPGTLAFVITMLKEQRDLALLYLNFSAFLQPKECAIEGSWFDNHLEPYASEGAAVFQHSIEKCLGAVMFITSTIYRTKLVKIALRKWTESVHNWAGMAYWTGYCAMHGDVFVTKDNYVVCVIGNSHWEKENKVHARIRLKDIPEVCYKLYELGYPYEMCKQVISKHLKEFQQNSGKRAYISAFRHWGTATAAALAFVFLPFHSAFQSESLIPRTMIETKESRIERSQESIPSD